MAKPARKLQQEYEHPEFGVCRGFNHEFPPPTDPSAVRFITKGDLGVVLEVDQSCLNCGTVRKRYLDPDTGIRLEGGYDYPKGYLRVGLGRMSPGEEAGYRVSYLRSLVGARRLRRLKAVR